eukprot:6533158-Alexandrium_andersonii.AAC.1
MEWRWQYCKTANWKATTSTLLLLSLRHWRNSMTNDFWFKRSPLSRKSSMASKDLGWPTTYSNAASNSGSNDWEASCTTSFLKELSEPWKLDLRRS